MSSSSATNTSRRGGLFRRGSDLQSKKEQRVDDIVSYARLAVCGIIGIGTTVRMRQVIEARGIPDGLFGILPSGGLLGGIFSAVSSAAQSATNNGSMFPEGSAFDLYYKWAFGKNENGTADKLGMVAVKETNMPIVGMLVPKEFKKERTVDVTKYEWRAVYTDKAGVEQKLQSNNYDTLGECLESLTLAVEQLRKAGTFPSATDYGPYTVKVVTGYDVNADFQKDVIAISYGAMASFIALMATDKEVLDRVVPAAKGAAKALGRGVEVGAKAVDAVLPDSIV